MSIQRGREGIRDQPGKDTRKYQQMATVGTSMDMNSKLTEKRPGSLTKLDVLSDRFPQQGK